AHTVGGATAMLSLTAAVQPRNLLDLKVERFRDSIQAANDLVVDPVDNGVDRLLDRRLEFVERRHGAAPQRIPRVHDPVLDLDGLVPGGLESATQRREHLVAYPGPAGAEPRAHRVPRVDGDALQPDRDLPQGREEPPPRVNHMLLDPG